MRNGWLGGSPPSYMYAYQNGSLELPSTGKGRGFLVIAALSMHGRDLFLHKKKSKIGPLI